MGGILPKIMKQKDNKKKIKVIDKINTSTLSIKEQEVALKAHQGSSSLSQLLFGVTSNRKLPEPITNTKVHSSPKTRLTISNRKRTASKLHEQRTKGVAPLGIIREAPKVFIDTLKSLLDKDGIKTIFTVEDMADQVVCFHNKLILNHGVIKGTKRFNDIRLYVLRLVEGVSPEPLHLVAISKVMKFPKKLSMLQELAYYALHKKCQTSDRVLRSLLYLNRLVKDNNAIDVDDLVRTFQIDPKEVTLFDEYVSYWVKKTGYECEADLTAAPTINLVSKGPNKVRKHESAHKEAIALVESDLWEPYCAFAKETGNLLLIKYIEEYSRLPLAPTSTSKNNISRRNKRAKRKTKLRVIASVPDKGNKARLVAISDYWTQVILKPLMQDAQSQINKYFAPVNSNTNHASGFEKLRKHIRPGTKSYDVVSWTDAFPALYQYIVVKHLYGDTLADAWLKLVVNCEWEVEGMTGPVRYGRGQGMGTNGSFDIATLTDLILLEMLYEKKYNMVHKYKRDFIFEKKLLFNKVGDDLWCYDPSDIIFDYYTRVIGLEINLNKTKDCPVNNCNNYIGEFVSRNLNWNQDVSRISANICRAVQRNPFEVFTLAQHLIERDAKTVLPLDYIDLTKLNKAVLLRSLRFYGLCNPSPAATLVIESLEKHYKSFYANDETWILLNFDDSKRQYHLRSIIVDSIFSTLGTLIDKIDELQTEDDELGYEEPIDLETCNIKRRCFSVGEGSFQELNNRTSKYIYWLASQAVHENLQTATESTTAFGDLMRLINEYSFAGTYTLHQHRASSYWYPSSPRKPSLEELRSLNESLSRLDIRVNFKGVGVVDTKNELQNRNITRTYLYFKHLECTVPTSLAPYGEEADTGPYLVSTLPNKNPLYKKYSEIFASLQCFEVHREDPNTISYKEEDHDYDWD